MGRKMKPHQKKWYGSLVVIMFLIVATALLLTNEGNDLTGMATDVYELEDAELGTITFNKEIIQISKLASETVWRGTTKSGDIVTFNPDSSIFWLDEDGDGEQDDNEVFMYSKDSGTGVTTFTSKDSAEISSRASLSSTSSSDPYTFTVAGTSGKQYTYEMVTIGGEVYARYEEIDETGAKTGDIFYYDKTGERWKLQSDGTLEDTGVKSDYLVKDGEVTDDFKELVEGDTSRYREDTTMKTVKGESSAKSAADRTKELAATAKEIGTTPENLYGEETAINAYLDLNENTKGVTYDVESGYYSGTTSEGTYIFHDKDGNTGTAVKVAKQAGGTEEIYILKEKGTLLDKPTYYQCTSIDESGICTAKVKYSGDTSDFSDAIADAKEADEDIQEEIQEQMKICKEPDNSDCKLKDGNTQISATARQKAFMNRMYEEQEAKVQGLIAGWLNGYIDELLGGWSRGVPAGICAYIFGLEYYKQDGWTRVTMNASVDQLQSQLIANSRTVIIEGEKEEITEDMFRYAYTIKLLANQSVEWQTYLYNSCTGDTSVDTFYDYGSLLAGGYFAFHYAGAGAQDMIFECEQEICLYDQACVVFADGTEPTCVSLVHGAGFETPVAGNDYDCAITG